MKQDRPPAVAEEISRLASLDPTARAAYLLAHGLKLNAETLVHLLREGARTGDTSLFQLCGRLLVGNETQGMWSGGHCERIIRSLARYYGFHDDQDVLQEFRSRCHKEMWKAIHKGHAEKPLWESRFGYCLKRTCIQEARGLVRRLHHQERERPLDELQETLGYPSSPLPAPESEALDRVTWDRLMAAVRRLPARQAQAVLLAWVEDRPVVGDAEDSVTHIMDISESRVHQLLRMAAARLREDPAVRALRDEA